MSNKKKAPAFELNAFTNIFSTPSVVTGPAGVPWYETLNCQDSVDMVYEYGHKAGEAYIGMGYFLKRIRDKELFKELGYETMTALAKDKFRIDDSAVCRMVNFCEKYSENNNSPVLDSKYKEYNQSQLIEMLSIKDDEVIKEITPDTTVREIREIKKKSVDEPTDDDIRLFFNHELRKNITAEQFADLKRYMYERYRTVIYDGAGSDLDFRGSSRGIIINHHNEITWAKFVSRVYLLEDLVPDSIRNQEETADENYMPGQMELESDFPEYCPKKEVSEESSIERTENKTEGNCDVANLEDSNQVTLIEQVNFPKNEVIIIDGEFREISEQVQDTKEPDLIEKEDVMIKYKCCKCYQQFILGEYATIGIAIGTPHCPYCKGIWLEELERAVPGEIENMGSMSIWSMHIRKR